MHHKHLTLQKQWPNVCWKGFHWPEVGHTMTCLSLHELMQRSIEPFDSHPTGLVKWPVRMKTIFMRVGSSLPITLLYQFWWIWQSALHPAPHKFQYHSLVCVHLPIVGAQCSAQVFNATYKFKLLAYLFNIFSVYQTVHNVQQCVATLSMFDRINVLSQLLLLIIIIIFIYIAPYIRNWNPVQRRLLQHRHVYEL